ncbi:hypothetical protein ACFO6R_16100 [Eubacterium multiforme]|uniref:Uncharacterized protein n=1 Tax=Eubacterium multiforme TaxID=83339 RepID=A0ABT9UTI4_9FIRM|nr:hypothetical protein [Eubacterium multiforme]MDQ0149615.1 hypothetical protein [Eubacterium multiforme]
MKMKYNRNFSKILSVIKNNLSKGVFSLGMGGLVAIYFIEFCRIRIIPNLKSINSNFYEVFITNNMIHIDTIELYGIIISIILIMIAPLLREKENLTICFFIVIIFIESVSFMSVFVHQSITKLFILGTILTSVYLIWFIIDILKSIYNWIHIEKSSKNQVDVTKLTFIWAIIIFLIGLLR